MRGQQEHPPGQRVTRQSDKVMRVFLFKRQPSTKEISSLIRAVLGRRMQMVARSVCSSRCVRGASRVEAVLCFLRDGFFLAVWLRSGNRDGFEKEGLDERQVHGQRVEYGE